jgi:magnesium transporter
MDDNKFSDDLFCIKKKLLEMRNFYDELVDLAQELNENELELFASKELRYFKRLANKSERLHDNIDFQISSIMHLKETYESFLEMKLNETMKLLTIFTAIFSPLTLIVGWYGMNLSMPEFNWRFGYLFVALLSGAVIALVLIFFKRKKWI